MIFFEDVSCNHTATIFAFSMSRLGGEREPVNLLQISQKTLEQHKEKQVDSLQP